MLRVVVDSNSLTSDFLRDFLSLSREHMAVLTDYAYMEAYKGDDPVHSIKRSMAILREFPDQVLVLKGTKAVGALDASYPGMADRMLVPKREGSFHETAKGLEQLERGLPGVVRQVRAHGEAANEQMKRVLADAEGIKDALVELGNLFSVDELRRLRTRQSYKSETGRKLFWIAKELSDRLVDYHPAQLHRPSRKARPNAFLYRYAMVCTLYLMDWLRHGAMPKKADRFRNDLVDLNFATYGTYFNGVMTEDAKLTRYHGELRYVLGLLGARVPPEYLDVLAAELANPGGKSDHIRFRL